MSSEWCILWGGVPNIVLEMCFCMAKFVKCVGMCKLVLEDVIEESSVWCLWSSFDAMWSWLVHQLVVAWVVWICTGCG